MQIKPVDTITKWCIWPVGVELKLYFSDRRTEWKYLGFNCSVRSWHRSCNIFISYSDGSGAENITTYSNTSAAWAHNTSRTQRISSSWEKKKKKSPARANDAANESVKLFSWCFSGVIRQHVSWSLKRFFPPGRGRVVMLALTVEIEPVQWKRGWQLEKIHSQSERSAEAGRPTFQSSDRSTLGSVPGQSWLNARPGGAHSKAYLSSSQLWSMEPLGSSFIVQYGTATKHSPADAGDRWQ